MYTIYQSVIGHFTRVQIRGGNGLRKGPVMASAAVLPIRSVATSSSDVSVPLKKNGKRPAWDLKGRVQDTEEQLKKTNLFNEELLSLLRNNESRLQVLEANNQQLTNEVLVKENHSKEVSVEVNTLKSTLKSKDEQIAMLKSQNADLSEQSEKLTSRLKSKEQECLAHELTISNLSVMNVSLRTEIAAKDREIQMYIQQLTELQETLNMRNETLTNLHSQLEQKDDKIRNNEQERRKLHNVILELKGNIRVFCRVRPLLRKEKATCDEPNVKFLEDDDKSLEIMQKGVKNKGPVRYQFSFDKVFGPDSVQKDVFEEISSLVQSSIDGYNVCVFAYGQTGSGKTYTMEGPDNLEEEHVGMIARSVKQVFQTTQNLSSLGWSYEIEATFLEVYNETIRDLLGDGSEDVKHEIKLDSKSSGDVYVSNVNSARITSPDQALTLLQRAKRRRAVAATKCNERSSRSHSVFRLRLKGHNAMKQISCDGTLNLIDLAGSERLKESQSTGERLNETKNINRSLANLGNVIMALMQKADHVPYRNSKLTHLLMNSLGGNSKTLMFVNISPKPECFTESVNALRFATQVNQCNIGTAQKRTSS